MVAARFQLDETRHQLEDNDESFGSTFPLTGHGEQGELDQ